MKYKEAGKTFNIVKCKGCKVSYIDGDGCPNYCIECENCGKMTKILELDPTLLLEADLEICITCASVWMEHVEGKTTTAEHVQIADMGDYRGRKN